LLEGCAEDCKTPIKPSEIIQKEFLINKNDNIYQAEGCSSCNHSGFKGRIALAECITISDELKALIHDEASEAKLIESAFKDNLSLDSSSSKLLRDGLTSYEELLRVQNYQDANL
jgi:general secretion pathway protein E